MAVAVDVRTEVRRFLETLEPFGPILAMKLYRLARLDGPDVPVIPCLDHEAMLHEGIAPHAAAYIQEAASGDLHEIVFVPRERHLEIDVVSTYGEHSAESQQRLTRLLRDALPGYRVSVRGPSWWRGERRVAHACLAQVALRDVLLNPDLDAVKAQVERLATIGTIMEKHSRAASWGVRTVMSPLLGAAGVVLFLLLGTLEPRVGNWLTVLRYGLLTGLGAWFLYYGVKAVQLTDMGNRVWKRSAEYSLILAERKRLGTRRAATPSSASSR
jgi:hypothetical protein